MLVFSTLMIIDDWLLLFPNVFFLIDAAPVLYFLLTDQIDCFTLVVKLQCSDMKLIVIRNRFLYIFFNFRSYSFDLTHSHPQLYFHRACFVLRSPAFSLNFLLVLATISHLTQGQDLSAPLRSWPCCIFIEKTEKLKKEQCLGWKLQIVYWFLFVLLNKSVWPWCPSGGFAWGFPLGPHVQ